MSSSSGSSRKLASRRDRRQRTRTFATSADAPVGIPTGDEDQEELLGSFLGWLVANGTHQQIIKQ